MSWPNILFVTMDSQRADACGFANPAVRTPHLDALAARGTRFSKCITPGAASQTARASILTGLLPLSNGAWDSGVDLPVDTAEKGFARQLARAGYATSLVGKAHFSTRLTSHPTGRAECRHSTARYPDTWRGPYMGFDHVQLVARHAPPGPDASATAWTTERAVAEVARLAKGRAPFCLWVSFADPQPPFDCPPPWNALHDPKQVPLPPHRVRDLERRPKWHAAVLEAAKARRLPFGLDPLSDAQLTQTIANAWGAGAFIDQGLGRLLDALEANGIAGETIVVAASVHGDPLGEHGLCFGGPMMYEGLVKVPLVMAGAGIAAGAAIDDPVSTLDLAPTFLEWANVRSERVLHGSSLVPVLAGSRHRDVAFSEARVHPSRYGFPLDLRVVRTQRYKAIFELKSGENELYDLQEDPHELVNRFGDGSYAAVRREMDEMLAERPGRIREDLAEPVGTE